ncbi:unnamed protein product [Alopecurus aequalis]
MPRGKVETKKIDDDVSRQVTFGKRRAELLNKARELALLCDADVGILVFSRAGQPFDYCSPLTSWNELIQRYESTTNAQLQGKDHEDDQVQQMFTEMAELRREGDRLEASLRRHTGEDLPSGATRQELANLEQQLESTLGKVRDMKDELLNHQLNESHRRVNILEDQNSFLRHVMNEQYRAAMEASGVAAEGMATPMLPFGGFFPEVEEGLSTSLQLWPQQLPDVHGFGPQPSMRLW